MALVLIKLEEELQIYVFLQEIGIMNEVYLAEYLLLEEEVL